MVKSHSSLGRGLMSLPVQIGGVLSDQLICVTPVQTLYQVGRSLIDMQELSSPTSFCFLADGVFCHSNHAQFLIFERFFLTILKTHNKNK